MMIREHREQPDAVLLADNLGAVEQLHDPVIVGVEDQRTASLHPFGDERLDMGNVLERLDPVLSDVIQLDVRYHSDIGPVVAKAAPNDAAARRLEDGDLNERI